jgi:hypothetical protein
MAPQNTRRGYVPTDAKDFDEESVIRLRRAQRDILYLLDQGYGIESSAGFVGNHFQLSSRQRLALLRATCSSAARESRSGRMLGAGTCGQGAVSESSGEFRCGETVHIDGFNSIITLEAAMSEETTLLRCMDGAIRDLCGLHGTYRIIESTAPAVTWIVRRLKQAGASRLIFYLDAPVSNSGKLAALIRKILEQEDLPPELRLLPNSDTALFGKAQVVSGDALVLDRCLSWLNLTGAIITEQLPRRRFVELCG